MTALRGCEELAVAEAITAIRDKAAPSRGLTPTPLPTIKYLERLFSDEEARNQEFARLLELQSSLEGKKVCRNVVHYAIVV